MLALRARGVSLALPRRALLGRGLPRRPLLPLLRLLLRLRAPLLLLIAPPRLLRLPPLRHAVALGALLPLLCLLLRALPLLLLAIGLLRLRKPLFGLPALAALPLSLDLRSALRLGPALLRLLAIARPVLPRQCDAPFLLRALLPLRLRPPLGQLPLPLLGIEARRLTPEILALPAGEAHRRALARLPLGRPATLRLRLVPIAAIARPLRLRLPRLAPAVPVAPDRRALRRPLPRLDPLAVARPRHPAHVARPRIIARGIGVARPRLAPGQRPAAAIIDRHQPLVAIAIAVPGVAHQPRARRARLVIIIAIAAIDRLGIAQIIVAALPRPGRHAILVGEAVIGRRLAQRLGEHVRPVDPGIAIVALRLRIGDRRGGGQLLDRRRIAGRRRRGSFRHRHRLGVGQRRQGRALIAQRRHPAVIGQAEIRIVGPLVAARGQSQGHGADPGPAQAGHFHTRHGASPSHPPGR